MRRIIYSAGITVLLIAAVIIGCTKSVNNSTDVSNSGAGPLTDDEKSLVQSAGFNENWAERTADDNYLIEGDILLTRAQLREMSGGMPTHNFIVADEEQYRTYNVVSTPN